MNTYSILQLSGPLDKAVYHLFKNINTERAIVALEELLKVG
jgi:hypothetical protein